jgi:hypothetical protein
MIFRTCAAALAAGFVFAPALAQTLEPPAIETMTCAQMQDELVVAGQRMNTQLDPEFATEAQAMQQEAQGAGRRNAAGAFGSAAVCAIPGLGAACVAAQRAQAESMRGQAAEHNARMQAQVDRLGASMQGLDQDRLTALSQRFERDCPQPPQG